MIVSDYMLSVFCAESYSDRPQQFVGWETSLVVDYATDSAALVARAESGELVIAPRGTDTTRDMWRHLAALGKVDGCHPKWHASAAALAEIVYDVACDAETVYLIGHSLGGADADIMATMHPFQFMDPHVVTFGAPPAGNREHSQDVANCAASYTRYVLGDDKITRWASLWLLGYRHPVPATRLQDPDWWPYNNHGIGRYVAAMEAISHVA